MSNELVNFYNLRLRTGDVHSKYEELTGELGLHPKLDPLTKIHQWENTFEKLKDLRYPNDKEKEGIIELFEKYVPHILRRLTPSQKEQVRKFISNQQLMEEIREQFHDKSLLKKYAVELNLCQTLAAFEMYYGVSWFESHWSFGDMSGFISFYIETKRLVDGYLKKEVPLSAIDFLNRIRIRNPQKIMAESQDGLLYHIQEISDPIDLHKYKLVLRSPNILYLRPYELNLDDKIFYIIPRQLESMLMGELQIKRCDAGQTPQMPACQNIFIPQRKEAKYCSKRCNNRVNQVKRNERYKNTRKFYQP